MESDQEIRLRLIEAAARNPTPHKDGYAIGILEAAKAWEEYVVQTRKTLGLPKKGL